MHELVHSLYQHGVSGLNTRGPSVRNSAQSAPAWFTEGLADLLPELAIAHTRGETYSNQGVYEWTLMADKPLQFYDTYPDPATGLFGHAYAQGELAVGYLASKVGLSAILDYYVDLQPNDTWDAAFEKAYGMSTQQFYDEFEQHRAAGFPELVTPKFVD